VSTVGERVGVGVVGCGNISGVYLANLPRHNVLGLVACADQDMARAEAKAHKYGTRACTVELLLADPAVEIVLNLTTPAAHAGVALRAVAAGKHVYNEKPLALAAGEARALLVEARAQGVLVGCAPDTFLGGGLQTCRKLIDDGAIGEPVAATAFMLCHGHERWHPDPTFYYQHGGGPMLDMGPYYLTALVSLLGPIRRVTGSARITFAERTITSQPKQGTKIPVEVPTHLAGVLDFAQGAIGTVVTSFDVWHAQVPAIEIYGTEGSLSVPDPNGFGGPVRLRQAAIAAWQEVPLTHGYTGNSRGVGVADMARAIRTGRPPRAGGELAYHVLEVMAAVEEASSAGRHIEIASTCARPSALPVGLADGTMD